MSKKKRSHEFQLTQPSGSSLVRSPITKKFRGGCDLPRYKLQYLMPLGLITYLGKLHFLPAGNSQVLRLLTSRRPDMRDMLVEDPERYSYSRFSTVYSPYVSVNWPYDPEDAVMEFGKETILSPIFEKHIRRLDNWTLASPFHEYLPGLASVSQR